jgi:hypothetical protein
MIASLFDLSITAIYSLIDFSDATICSFVTAIDSLFDLSITAIDSLVDFSCVSIVLNKIAVDEVINITESQLAQTT